ncbi:hypothetical protein JHD48_09490 [Sulfurimonas sp. SAG-AH-194-I05]|nr:hypothetical protein [Sulfurimonas sp. SAG-AH-194-I05]MDF1875967.1 hypothetical protein [Sulfurimonas sp. SAG-AH-194-I05]
MQHKIFILFLLTLSSFAQENYTTGKIDMHGGKESNYGSFTSSKFGNNTMNMSAFLDTNASKKIKTHPYGGK